MSNSNSKIDQKFKELMEDEENLNWFIDNYAPRLRQKCEQAHVSGSLPIANPHHCPECSWQCTCSNQPCSCCQGNDR